MTKLRFHVEVSNNPLNDDDANKLIEDLQPLIKDIAVNGIMKISKEEEVQRGHFIIHKYKY